LQIVDGRCGERIRTEITRLELAMLDAPALSDDLRPLREEALAALKGVVQEEAAMSAVTADEYRARLREQERSIEQLTIAAENASD
jgi:hypothetical protein